MKDFGQRMEWYKRLFPAGCFVPRGREGRELRVSQCAQKVTANTER